MKRSKCQPSSLLDDLPCMRCKARPDGGDAVAVDCEIAIAIETGGGITNPGTGEHQIIGRFRSIHRHLGMGLGLPGLWRRWARTL